MPSLRSTAARTLSTNNTSPPHSFRWAIRQPAGVHAAYLDDTSNSTESGFVEVDMRKHSAAVDRDDRTAERNVVLPPLFNVCHSARK